MLYHLRYDPNPFFLVVLGFKLRVFMFAGQALYHLSHSSSPSFCFYFVFESGCCYLTCAGLKLAILLPQLAELLELQVCSIML
jgi:hypothetical protein